MMKYLFLMTTNDYHNNKHNSYSIVIDINIIYIIYFFSFLPLLTTSFHQPCLEGSNDFPYPLKLHSMNKWIVYIII